MGFSRRDILKSMGLLGAASPFGLAFGDSERLGNNLNFIFVVAYGGWDPTRVFATEFDNPNVDMERTAEPLSASGLSYVGHESRPNVDTFFEAYGERALILNGVLVPAIAHLNCIRLMLTGTTSTTASDWPAIIAAKSSNDFALPHLVLDGPSFPGDLGSYVSRTGSSGQLEALLDGSILDWSDLPVNGPSQRAEDIMDLYLERRSTAVEANAIVQRELEFAESFGISHATASALKGLVGVSDFGGGGTFANQIRLAVDSLAVGVSRCATISYTGNDGWDSHSGNDATQARNFDELFEGLQQLMHRLDNSAGLTTTYMSGETVVVVLSEMGRTPQLNDSDGKDHWPYTSMMMLGPGITTNRVVGGFNSYYYGDLLDPSTAELDPDGVSLSASAIGATLLNLADIDHEEFMPGVASIPGLLA